MEKFVIYRDTVSSQENMLNTLVKTNEIKHINKYDNLNRLVSKVIKTDTNTFSQNYTYNKTRVTSFTTFNTTYNYQYDEMGNVINANGSTYTYDKYGRLLTSNYNGINKYTYDNNGNLSKIDVLDSNGNITSSTIDNRSASNGYRLTSVTGNINASLSYGSGHNTLNITINGVSRAITYEGKRIIVINNNQYFYNEEGVRTRKIIVNDINGTYATEIHDYILEGNKIIKEIVYGDSRSYEIYFNYDMHKQLIGFEYENNTYSYVRDPLGNINHIIDQNKNLMVSYECDELLLTSLVSGSINLIGGYLSGVFGSLMSLSDISLKVVSACSIGFIESLSQVSNYGINKYIIERI